MLGKRPATEALNPEDCQLENQVSCDSLRPKFVLTGHPDARLAEEQELKQLVKNVAKKLTYDEGADQADPSHEYNI